jgi:L-cysteine desulfidase
MERSKIDEILSLIKREVVPAIGCTEPIAVALAVAKAKEVLNEPVLRIEANLSSNILKNSMGVGIPGTGMIGLPIAMAMGAVIGKSEYGLEVLKDTNSSALKEAKKLVAAKKTTVNLKREVPDNLYIEAICYGAGNVAKAIICGNHSNIVYADLNGKVLLDELANFNQRQAESEEVALNFDIVCDFAMSTPLADLEFILQAAELNTKAASESENGNYGHSVGKILQDGTNSYIMGDNLFSRIVSSTSSACDVRMAGAMIPVMSNSGSGNQGITATLPVLTFAKEKEKSEEELIRALTISHLMLIYIKRNLGRLSGLCGVTVAGIGSSCGITYLMGGSRRQIGYCIINMIGNITGVICDGAKPSCSLKASSAASSATISAMMAMDNKVVSSQEGIVGTDVDKTIRNLTMIGSVGMEETDKLVLDIMTGK